MFFLFAWLVLAGMSPQEEKRREADRLYEQGDFAAAAVRLRDILAAAPADHHNRLNLIDCLRFLGREDDAAREAEKLGESTAERLLYQAQETEDRGEMTAAVELYQTMLVRNPALDRGRVEYTACLLRAARPLEAFRQMGLLAADPENHPELLWLTALYYRLAGNYDQADPYLEAVLTITPRDGFAQSELYRNRRSLGRPVDAGLYFSDDRQFFMRPLLEAVFDGILGQNAAETWIEALKKPGAAIQGRTAIRALLELKTGQIDAACSTASEAVTRWPTENLCHLAAGIALWFQADARGSAEIRRKATTHLRHAFRAGRRLDDPRLFQLLLQSFLPDLPETICSTIQQICTRYSSKTPPPYTPAELFDLTLR